MAGDVLSKYDEPAEWKSLDPVELGLEITRAYVNRTDFTQFIENADNKSIRLITNVVVDTIELADPERLARILNDPAILAQLMENIEKVADLAGVLDKVDPRFRAAWETAQSALEVANFLKDIDEILTDFPDQLKDQVLQLTRLANKTWDTLDYLADRYEDIVEQIPEIGEFFEPFTVPLRDYYESGRRLLEGKVETVVSLAVPDSVEEKLEENGFDLFGSDVVDGVKDLYGIAKLGVSIFDTLGDIFGSAEDDPNSDREIRNGDSTADLSIHTGGGNDTIRTGSGNDSIVTGDGNDDINAGDGINEIVSGNGNDIIRDGKDGSIVTAGPGADWIYDLGGGDVLDGGLGLDTYVYPTDVVGNDRIVDTSRAGTLLLESYRFDEINVRKDRYDLEILMPQVAGRTENSIRFTDYFKYDRSEWVIRDQTGAQLKLDWLLGRFDFRSAMQIATVSDDLADLLAILPANTNHLVRHEVVTATAATYQVDLFSDQRGAVGGRPTLGVLIHSNRDLDGFLSRHQLGGLKEADEILAALTIPQGSLSDFKNVTVLGTGSGGVMAQWVASALSTSVGNRDAYSVANVYAINAPDVSGMIQDTVGGAHPEYALGMPRLNTTLMHHEDDWASRYSAWAGNEQSYATWVRWHVPDVGPEFPIESQVGIDSSREAHAFSHADFNTGTMEYGSALGRRNPVTCSAPRIPRCFPGDRRGRNRCQL